MEMFKVKKRYRNRSVDFSHRRFASTHTSLVGSTASYLTLYVLNNDCAYFLKLNEDQRLNYCLGTDYLLVQVANWGRDLLLAQLLKQSDQYHDLIEDYTEFSFKRLVKLVLIDLQTEKEGNNYGL
jgi:hypothetical protein